MGRHFYKGQSKISLADKMGEERKVKSVGCPLFPAAAAVEGGTSNGYCLVGPDLIHSSFSSLSPALPFFCPLSSDTPHFHPLGGLRNLRPLNPSVVFVLRALRAQDT